MTENITLRIKGREVVIPDRTEDKWLEMAVNLYKYVFSTDMQQYRIIERLAQIYPTWKKAAIDLYIKALTLGGG